MINPKIGDEMVKLKTKIAVTKNIIHKERFYYAI